MTSNYSERPRLTLHRPLLCMVASSRPRSGRGGRTQVRKMFVRSSSGPRPAVADWLSEVVPDWLAVGVLVVIAGVSAIMARLGGVGSVTGLQLIIYSSLGLGPVGALRPWWHTALEFIVGAVWALALLLPGWLLSPRAAEQRA